MDALNDLSCSHRDLINSKLILRLRFHDLCSSLSFPNLTIAARNTTLFSISAFSPGCLQRSENPFRAKHYVKMAL